MSTRKTIASSQASDSEITSRLRRIAKIRFSYLALIMFSAATVSFWSPLSRLALVRCVLLIYMSPRLPHLLRQSVC
jgi:hypothetical protein